MVVLVVVVVPWRQTRKSLVRWDREDLWGQKQWSTSKRVILGRRTLGVLSQQLNLIELNEYELNMTGIEYD